MSTKTNSVDVIPRTAWIIAGTLAALVIAGLWYGPMQHEREVREWPLELRALLLVLPAMLVGGYALLVGFIYGDAKRRHMRHVMWAWLAMVPYFLGVIPYFILRDPLPTPCPKCSNEVPHNFSFCPICGTAVHPFCSQCGKQVEGGWANCPHCGTSLPKSTGAVTPVV